MMHFLALLAAMTKAEWNKLTAVVPKLIDVGGGFGTATAEVFHAVEKKIETGLSHTEAANELITEGFAVKGWTDEETQKWLDNATGPQGSNVGSG